MFFFLLRLCIRVCGEMRDVPGRLIHLAVHISPKIFASFLFWPRSRPISRWPRHALPKPTSTDSLPLPHHTIILLVFAQNPERTSSALMIVCMCRIQSFFLRVSSPLWNPKFQSLSSVLSRDQNWAHTVPNKYILPTIRLLLLNSPTFNFLLQHYSLCSTPKDALDGSRFGFMQTLA